VKVISVVAGGHPKSVQVAVKTLQLLASNYDFLVKCTSMDIMSQFVQMLSSLADHLQSALQVFLRMIRKSTDLARTAISANSVPVLLKLLNGTVAHQAKLICAGILQCLLRVDATLSPLLEAESVWSDYRMQPVPEDEPITSPVHSRKPNPYVIQKQPAPPPQGSISPTDSSAHPLMSSMEVMPSPSPAISSPAVPSATFTAAFAAPAPAVQPTPYMPPAPTVTAPVVPMVHAPAAPISPATASTPPSNLSPQAQIQPESQTLPSGTRTFVYHVTAPNVSLSCTKKRSASSSSATARSRTR